MSDNETTTTTQTTAPATPAPQQALAPRPPPPPIGFTIGKGADVKTWEDAQRMSTAFAASRYFKDVSEAPQALVKITMGAELGFSPMAAMLGIYIIEGRPAMSSAMINAVIKRSGRYRFEVKRWDEEACSLMWREKVDGEWLDLGPSSFTMIDATRANLAGKGVWKNYPKAMLWARALTQGARAYTPDLFFGAPVYTPEELGEPDMVDVDGVQVFTEKAEQVKQEQPRRGVAGVTAAVAAQAIASDAAAERAEKKAAKAAKEKEVTKPTTAPDPQPAATTTPSVAPTTPPKTEPTASEKQPASASTSAPPPPEASSSSESATETASSPPPSPDPLQGDDDGADADGDDDGGEAFVSPPAFVKAIAELSLLAGLGPSIDTKAMSAIVVTASTSLDPVHRTALRVFTRALFNKAKGVDVLTAITSEDDRAALGLALTIEGNAIGVGSVVLG